MGAETFGSEVEEEEGDFKTIIPEINIDEALSKYDHRIEINDLREIAEKFEENKDKKSVCLEIPIRGRTEEEVRIELALIDRELSHSIRQYTELDLKKPIGFEIYGILREMLGDIDKHARPNNRFNRIFVLVTKDGAEISFHIANPANSNADLSTIDMDYISKDGEGDLSGLGFILARGLSKESNKQKHGITKQPFYLTDESKRRVGIERNVEITDAR